MASTGSDTNSEAAATGVLADYYRAFSTLEVQAVLPHFHEPSLFIGPQGVFAASTSALVEAVFTPAMSAEVDAANTPWGPINSDGSWKWGKTAWTSRVLKAL